MPDGVIQVICKHPAPGGSAFDLALALVEARAAHRASAFQRGVRPDRVHLFEDSLEVEITRVGGRIPEQVLMGFPEDAYNLCACGRRRDEWMHGLPDMRHADLTGTQDELLAEALEELEDSLVQATATGGPASCAFCNVSVAEEEWRKWIAAAKGWVPFPHYRDCIVTRLRTRRRP